MINVIIYEGLNQSRTENWSIPEVTRYLERKCNEDFDLDITIEVIDTTEIEVEAIEVRGGQHEANDERDTRTLQEDRETGEY